MPPPTDKAQVLGDEGWDDKEDEGDDFDDFEEGGGDDDFDDFEDGFQQAEPAPISQDAPLPAPVPQPTITLPLVGHSVHTYLAPPG